MNNKNIITSIFLALCVICFFTFSVYSQEEPVYTIGVVPQFPPIAILEKWTPFIDYLSRETGFNFRIDTSESIPEFEKDLMQGEFDFVFMNPYHEVKAYDKQGYLPLVYDGSRKLVGILVTRNDSPIKTIQDLDGEEIAFPAPNAFGASHYMRALLTEKEKIHIIPRYLKTHDNVYRHVVLGRLIAGGGVQKTLKIQPDELQKQLRILYKTPGVTPHPLAAHPRIPKRVRASVVNAILKLYAQDGGKEILSNISIAQPVQADYDRDYKPLEELQLDKYWVPPQE